MAESCARDTELALAVADMSLCSNELCLNADKDNFEAVDVCGDGEYAVFIRCSSCQSEIPEDEWQAKLAQSRQTSQGSQDNPTSQIKSTIYSPPVEPRESQILRNNSTPKPETTTLNHSPTETSLIFDIRNYDLGGQYGSSPPDKEVHQIRWPSSDRLNSVYTTESVNRSFTPDFESDTSSYAKEPVKDIPVEEGHHIQIKEVCACGREISSQTHRPRSSPNGTISGEIGHSFKMPEDDQTDLLQNQPVQHSSYRPRSPSSRKPWFPPPLTSPRSKSPSPRSLSPSPRSLSPSPRSTHITSDFSCDNLTDVLSHASCQQCGSGQLSPVYGDNDKEIIMWHCEKCPDSVVGFDDTSSVAEACELVELLVYSFEHATLRADPCPSGCGNDDINLFWVDDELTSITCLNCGHVQQIVSDKPYPAEGGDISHPEDPRVKGSAFYEDPIDDIYVGRREITTVKQLKPADHIYWERDLTYEHHAIVSAVNWTEKKLKVCHYDGPEKHLGGKGVIKEEWLEVDCDKEALYKVGYTNCDPPEVVLDRAHSRINEANYCLISNNCEHFARWCKTGDAISEQVEDFKQYAAHMKGRVMTSVIGLAKGKPKLRINRWSQVDKQALLTTAGSKLLETGQDIHALVKQHRKGTISKSELVRCSVQKSVEGATVIVCAVAGCVLDQFIPILGSTLGGTLGEIVGRAFGRYAGRQVVKGIYGK